MKKKNKKAQAAGKASAKKRHLGKTKAEISKFYSDLRRKPIPPKGE